MQLHHLNRNCQNNLFTTLCYITPIINNYTLNHSNYWQINNLTDELNEINTIKTLYNLIDYGRVIELDIDSQILFWLFKAIYIDLALKFDKDCDFHLLRVDHILETYYIAADDKHDENDVNINFTDFDNILFDIFDREVPLIHSKISDINLHRLLQYLNKNINSLSFEAHCRNIDIFEYVIQNSLLHSHHENWFYLCKGYFIILNHLKQIVEIINEFEPVSLINQPSFDGNIVMNKLLHDWLPIYENNDTQKSEFYENAIKTFMKPLDIYNYMQQFKSRVEVHNNSIILKASVENQEYDCIDYHCRKTLYEVIDQDKFNGLRILGCIDLINNFFTLHLKITDFKDRHIFTKEEIMHSFQYVNNESLDYPLLVNLINDIWCIIYKSTIYCLGAGAFTLIATFMYLHNKL